MRQSSPTIDFSPRYWFSHQSTFFLSTLLVPCYKTGSVKWLKRKWHTSLWRTSGSRVWRLVSHRPFSQSRIPFRLRVKSKLNHLESEPHTVPFYSISCSFNSDFSVLFRFPSQYLFAIGVTLVFRLNTYIRANSDCNHKQSYSWERARFLANPCTRGFHSVSHPIPGNLTDP